MFSCVFSVVYVLLVKTVKWFSVSVAAAFWPSSDLATLSSLFTAGPHWRWPDEKRSFPGDICTLHRWLSGFSLGLEMHRGAHPPVKPAEPPPSFPCLSPSSSGLREVALLYHHLVIIPTQQLSQKVWVWLHRALTGLNVVLKLAVHVSDEDSSRLKKKKKKKKKKKLQWL